MTARRPYSRHGLHVLKAKVKVAGLVALDGRTAAAQALLDWRRSLIADLGGATTISAQQCALIEVATRTRLYIDHLDAFLLGQRSLVNAKRKAVLPVLKERQTLADSLARILAQLGLERRKPSAQSLDEVLRAIAAEKDERSAPGGVPQAGAGDDPDGVKRAIEGGPLPQPQNGSGGAEATL
jgi:hypothetical protein